MREASGSRQPAGLPGRCRQRRAAADRVRCAERAAGPGRAAGDDRHAGRRRSTIKAAKLRGVESNGMLCSAKELGIDADASGLLELPADAPVGTPLADYLGLPDASIETQADARTAPTASACAASRSTWPRHCGSEVEPLDATPMPALNDATLAVELDAGAKVPRFVGRVIEGVDATVADAGVDGRAPAPQRRASDQLPGRRHPVRDARARPADACLRPRHAAWARSSCAMRATARTLKLLDGRDGGARRRLPGGRPTRRPARVRRAGRHHGRRRHPRDRCDAQRVPRSRALAAVRDHRPRPQARPAHRCRPSLRARRRSGAAAAGHRTRHPADRRDRRWRAGPGDRGRAAGAPAASRRRSRCVARASRACSGIEIADAEVERILRALGMQVEANADGWQVVAAHAPLRHRDRGRPDRGNRAHPRLRRAFRPRCPAARRACVCAQRNARRGVDARVASWPRATTSKRSTTPSSMPRCWRNGALADGAVPLANPLSAELGVMRTRLLPGWSPRCSAMLARQQARVRLFETRQRSSPPMPATRPSKPSASPRSPAATRQPSSGASTARKVDFHDLKGDLDSLAALSGAALEYRPSASRSAHPGPLGRRVCRDGDGGDRLDRPAAPAPAARAGPGWRRVRASSSTWRPAGARVAAGGGAFPVSRPSAGISRSSSPDDVPWAAIARHRPQAAVGPLLRELRAVRPLCRRRASNPDSKSLAMGLILQDELTHSDRPRRGGGGGRGGRRARARPRRGDPRLKLARGSSRWH